MLADRFIIVNVTAKRSCQVDPSLLSCLIILAWADVKKNYIYMYKVLFSSVYYLS